MTQRSDNGGTHADKGATQLDNANDASGQHHSPDVQAGDPPPAGTNTDDPPASNAPDTDNPNDTDDDGNPNHEAARWRRRLRESEQQVTERDQTITELRDTLERTRQSVVDNAVAAANLDPRLLVAAGHTVDTLVGDDGLIDHERLSQAIAATAEQFRVRRTPAPNPQQGTGSHHPGASTSQEFTAAFAPRQR
jgi:hypothetical protein